MAVTITSVAGADYSVANKRVRIRKITFDSSYPTGGESITASDVGLHKITEAIPHGAFRKTSDGSTAVFVSYDYTNSKLFAYRQKDPANAGGADIPLPEVGNTVDLSGFHGYVTFVGW